MRRRPFAKFRPALERFEDRQLPNASPLTAHAAAVAAHARAVASGDAMSAKKLPTGFLGFRVTNPAHKVPYQLLPPFKQVLVQKNQPIPGQVYNVMQVAVRNGTAQTFTAANNFKVRLNSDAQRRVSGPHRIRRVEAATDDCLLYSHKEILSCTSNVGRFPA